MSEAVDRLVALADPERAAGMARFFQSGSGQYGEGDVFLGLTVPQVTAVAKQDLGLSVADLEELLEDERHEEAGKQDEARLLAYLDEHGATMPRTTLRYALERLTPDQRAHYMHLKKRTRSVRFPS